MSKSKDFISDLPPWAKGFITVVGVAAVAFSLYQIYKVVHKIANPADTKKEMDAVESEIKTLTGSGQKTNITPAQIQIIVNQIFAAFNGPAEDEQAVYRAFANVKSDVDMLNLIKAWGVKKTGYLLAGSVYYSSFTGTLAQTITHYFNGAEIKALNDMLSRKGIKYRF